MKAPYRMKSGLRSALLFVIAACALTDSALGQEASNGQLRQQQGKLQAWHTAANSWLGIEAFWIKFATEHRGKYWGRSSNYPTYNDVNEHDTILIEAEGGPCLMYFFHSRWRRAQDVRRWDPAFNEALGCPRVFD